MKHAPHCLSLFYIVALPAFAVTTVFDFETAADLNALPYRTQNKTALAVVQTFATAGTNALRFTTAAWKKGLPEWPAFELKPAVRDWKGYDRLVVDITNPNEEQYPFALFVSDTNTPVRKGLHQTFAVPSYGYARMIVPLSAFPETVKRSEVATLHFFTERPQTDMTLYLDNITLLKKGETQPEPSPAFVRQLPSLSQNALSAADHALAAIRDATQSFCDTPAAQANAKKQLTCLAERLKDLRCDLSSDGLTLAKLKALQTELSGMSNRSERLLSTLRFQQACAKAHLPTGPLLVGVATSMEQIMPRVMPFDLRPAREVAVRLARNEKESVQVVVLPADEALGKVSVHATDLTASDGSVFKRAQIDCDVVGYVETRNRPPYGTSHVGWWPDPILNFLGPVDIAAGDLQSFWIRVRAPADQPPGEYRGKLTVTAENAPAVALDLRVRVYGFALPSASPLPLAITFAPEDSPLAETPNAQTAWRKTADYPVNAWKKHKLRWADFLADYYITYDSLYHHGTPDFDVLKHLQRQGRLGVFNLGYWHYFDSTEKSRADWQANTLDRLHAVYAQAKDLDLLKNAYIYGCDEVPTNHFARVEEAAARIKAACPGVPIMTTTYDHSFGMTSGIGSVDAFCPLTPKFDPAQAAAARAAGKQVWWYICCGPHHPHANMFIEYPAIEGRLLMGAMTAKMRPDGFLYYQISIWNSEKPITSGPFTDWNPRSWTTYHGDGAWTCVGPDGTPLPTVRLENFRDGLEDFAYVRILEDLVKQRAADTGNPWLAEAKAALAVPESLVKSMTEYSRTPQTLYAWRNRLAELIASAPAPLEPLLK
jgi:hypothetical protein